MPDSDEHENDIYEDEEVELSDDDPPAPLVIQLDLIDIPWLATVVHLINSMEYPKFVLLQLHLPITI